MTDERPYLSPQEMAPLLGVPLRWFYGSKREPSGAVKAGLKVRRIGGYLRVRPCDFDEYLEQNLLTTD